MHIYIEILICLQSIVIQIKHYRILMLNVRCKVGIKLLCNGCEQILWRQEPGGGGARALKGVAAFCMMSHAKKELSCEQNVVRGCSGVGWGDSNVTPS